MLFLGVSDLRKKIEKRRENSKKELRQRLRRDWIVIGIIDIFVILLFISAIYLIKTHWQGMLIVAVIMVVINWLVIYDSHYWIRRKKMIDKELETESTYPEIHRYTSGVRITAKDPIIKLANGNRILVKQGYFEYLYDFNQTKPDWETLDKSQLYLVDMLLDDDTMYLKSHGEIIIYSDNHPINQIKREEVIDDKTTVLTLGG
jgi:hypothetical protein